jgi:hypothetical protein
MELDLVKAGDTALIPVRIVAVAKMDDGGYEACVMHERPADLAAALRQYDIDRAINLTKHVWVRLGVIVPASCASCGRRLLVA